MERQNFYWPQDAQQQLSSDMHAVPVSTHETDAGTAAAAFLISCCRISYCLLGSSRDLLI